jgi:hypothetical protein
MGDSILTTTTQISAGDAVEFIGPPNSPVIGWPTFLERGVVTRIQDGQGIAIVVWQQTTTVLAWPSEWLHQVYGLQPVGGRRSLTVGAA